MIFLFFFLPTVTSILQRYIFNFFFSRTRHTAILRKKKLHIYHENLKNINISRLPSIICLPASIIASTDLSRFTFCSVSTHSLNFLCMLKKTLSNFLKSFSLLTPDGTPYSPKHVKSV